MVNSFQIHPVSFIKAMSRALELSSVGISAHHRRTAIIARYIALETLRDNALALHLGINKYIQQKE